MHPWIRYVVLPLRPLVPCRHAALTPPAILQLELTVSMARLPRAECQLASEVQISFPACYRCRRRAAGASSVWLRRKRGPSSSCPIPCRPSSGAACGAHRGPAPAPSPCGGLRVRFCVATCVARGCKLCSFYICCCCVVQCPWSGAVCGGLPCPSARAVTMWQPASTCPWLFGCSQLIDAASPRYSAATSCRMHAHRLMKP